MEIILRDGEIALIDEIDYDKIMALHPPGCVGWYCAYFKNGKRYALSSRSRKVQSMHREILGLERRKPFETRKKIEVDHINGDGLDNRRGNLRVCSRGQNQANRGPKSGKRYKGIYKCPSGWVAMVAGRYAGYSRVEEEAACLYDKGAKKRWGEFAYLNFPLDSSKPRKK